MCFQLTDLFEMAEILSFLPSCAATLATLGSLRFSYCQGVPEHILFELFWRCWEGSLCKQEQP